MLERFGVDVLDEAVYRALLMEPQATAAQLAVMDGRDTSTIASTLERLAGLGLVTPDRSAASGFTAQAPQFALELLIRREEQRLELERQRLRAARDTVPDLVDEYVALRARILGPEVEVLDDIALVRARLFQLSREAKSSVWSIHPGGPLTEAQIDHARPLDQQTADRHVECRLIVSSESLGPESWQTYLGDLMDLGEQVRILSSPPLRCVIVDRKHAVVPGPGRDGDDGAYVLHGTHLLAPVLALFESLWVQAQPLAIEGRQAELVVTEERMRQVSAMLSAGMKDEAVARRLGVSVRTVRRVIAATMQALHADSRWQAGALASRHGWDGTDADGRG